MFRETGLGGYIDRERGNAMTAAEKQLERELEFYKMRVAELHGSDMKLNKVVDLIDNAMQIYDDRFMKSHDVDERVNLFDRWKVLRDIKDELEQLEL